MATKKTAPTKPATAKKRTGRAAEIDPKDLERMRALYETGMFDANALAKMFNCAKSTIYRQVRSGGWAIGATAAIVRKRTRERIEASEEAIEEAVRTNIEIIREHQRIGMRGRDLGLRMLAELEDTMDNLPTIEELIEIATDDEAFSKLRAKLQHRTSTNARAVALRDLAAATKHWIEIERVAFNLDGARDDDPEKWPDERINARIAELLREAGARTSLGDEAEEGEEA